MSPQILFSQLAVQYYQVGEECSYLVYVMDTVLPASSHSLNNLLKQLLQGYTLPWPCFKGPYFESLLLSCQPEGGHSGGVGQRCLA